MHEAALSCRWIYSVFASSGHPDTIWSIVSSYLLHILHWRSFFIFGRSGLSVISWYLTVSHFLRISFFIVIILSSGFVFVGFCVLPGLSGNVGVFSSTFTSTISCLSVSSIPGLDLFNSSGVEVACLSLLV